MKNFLKISIYFFWTEGGFTAADSLSIFEAAAGLHIRQRLKASPDYIRHFLLLIRFLLIKGVLPACRPRADGPIQLAFSMGFSQLFSLPMTFHRLLSLPTVFTTGFEISSSTNLTERADLKFVYSSFPSFNAFPTNIYHDQKLQPEATTTLSTV